MIEEGDMEDWLKVTASLQFSTSISIIKKKIFFFNS